MLKQKLQENLKVAMKARDSVRMSTIRQVLAAVKNFEIAEKSSAVSDYSITAILRREAKKRKEAIEIYEKNGREDRAEAEKSELRIIEEYLPGPVGDAELDEIIKRITAAIKPSGPANFGKIMGAVVKEVAGRRDSDDVAGRVRAVLDVGL